MISMLSKKQICADVSNFFGSFRNYEHNYSCYNLGLGEIICKNNLIKELKNYSDLITRDILRNIKHYPGCQGYKPLNEKICELIKIETGQDFNPEEIIITNGAYDAITNAIFTYSDVNQNILCSVPSFPYWSCTARTSTLFKPVLCDNLDIYQNQLGNNIENEIDKKTSMIILNNPHNPLGVSVSKEQANIINDITKKNKIKVLLDDVYRVFSKEEWIGNYFDLDNVIVVDSLSKRFGLPGLRLGFVRVPKNEIKYFRASVANQYVGVNTASVVIADYLLDIHLNDRSLNNIPREIERRQRKLDVSLRKLTHKEIKSPRPDCSMFRILYCNNANELHKDLEYNNVLVNPAKSSFPDNFNDIPEFIRLSVGGESRIKEAVEKIKEVVEMRTPICEENKLVVN